MKCNHCGFDSPHDPCTRCHRGVNDRVAKPSSPPDRALHCYRHDQPYVGRCDGCVTGDPPVLNQRPESYSTKGRCKSAVGWRHCILEDCHAQLHQSEDGTTWADKAVEKPKLGVEQVHAELLRLRRQEIASAAVTHFSEAAYKLIDQLPRVDVEGLLLEELDKFVRVGEAQRPAIRAMIRRYRELGCPEVK